MAWLCSLRRKQQRIRGFPQGLKPIESKRFMSELSSNPQRATAPTPNELELGLEQLASDPMREILPASEALP